MSGTPVATSQVAIRYGGADSPYGTPAGGNWKNIRFTGESLSGEGENTTSQVIRDDGQIDNLIQVDVSAKGEIETELAYDTDNIFNDWTQRAFLAAGWESTPAVFTAGGGATATLTPAAAGVPNKVVIGADSFLATGGSVTGQPFAVGMWIKLAGSVAANNDIYKIVALTSTTMFLTGKTFSADAGAQTDIIITQCADVTNGKTTSAFSLEKDFGTGDNFEIFKGLGVDPFSVTIPTKGAITAKFGFVGARNATSASTSGGTPVAAPTSEPMTAGGHAFRVLEGDYELLVVASASLATNTPLTGVTGFDFTISPSLRGRNAVGTVGSAFSPGRGDMDVTGTLRAYFDANTAVGKAAIAKFIATTETSLAVLVKNTALQTFIFDFPKVKFESVTAKTPAKSQDVILEAKWRAYRHPYDTNQESGVSGVTCRMARVTAPS